MNVIYLLLIVGIAVLFLVMLALFVLFTICHAVRLNSQYETFAKQHGYQLDKAQGQDGYRHYSSHKVQISRVRIELVANPYVDKYANFQSYPFGRGTEKKVTYVISGEFRGATFQAFTYLFTDNSSEKSAVGGVFSIVKILSDPPLIPLPENMFFENGVLCEYEKGNLQVDTIHERIENLMKYTKGKK